MSSYQPGFSGKLTASEFNKAAADNPWSSLPEARSKSHAVTDKLPDYTDFVWVKRQSKSKWELAYFYQHVDPKLEDCRWQNPYTVGDDEGLSVEYYTDVTHWRELEPPKDE